MAAAEARYLADLTRREVGRALRALSSCYVERRDKLGRGHALEGRGKRAAFALYYGPLHFLIVQEIARAFHAGLKPGRHLSGEPGRPIAGVGVEAGLQPRVSGPAPSRTVVDLGCGTGAAGAAWALETGAGVRGFDVNAWAVEEANWTYFVLGVRGRARKAAIADLRLPSEPSTIVAAFVINELDAGVRAQALDVLMRAAGAGHEIVVVEPIARRLTPWWDQWLKAFDAVGGHAREWRFRVELPRLLKDFDKAAGLDHRELTARTLTNRSATSVGPNI